MIWAGPKKNRVKRPKLILQNHDKYPTWPMNNEEFNDGLKAGVYPRLSILALGSRNVSECVYLLGAPNCDIERLITNK